jgi:hypothetical protein
VKAALAALALAAAPHGSALPDGKPFLVYASVTPRVHKFAEPVTATLTVLFDRRLVDPARLRISTGFAPYEPTGKPSVRVRKLGALAELRWQVALSCLGVECVPTSLTRVFRFPAGRVRYLGRDGRPLVGELARWPAIESVSQINPAALGRRQRFGLVDVRGHVAPVLPASFRASPGLLAAGALATGTLLIAAGLGLAARPLLVRRAPRAAAPALPPLDRALALLAWARERGDETLERKALERLAAELNGRRDLAREARELAWSPERPSPEATAELARRVREALE